MGGKPLSPVPSSLDSARYRERADFITLEDETGNANVIVMPDIYEKNRQAVLEPRFIRVSGTVQNQDGIAHLRAEHTSVLTVSAVQISSHDFH
jgi:error-prone DNA polymerase